MQLAVMLRRTKVHVTRSRKTGKFDDGSEQVSARVSKCTAISAPARSNLRMNSAWLPLAELEAVECLLPVPPPSYVFLFIISALIRRFSDRGS